jgi:hypothetical protein
MRNADAPIHCEQTGKRGSRELMPADGAQAAAWRGISARPAGSTDEITSVLAAQKEGENGRKWPDSAVSSTRLERQLSGG